jgi:hypothetical protein
MKCIFKRSIALLSLMAALSACNAQPNTSATLANSDNNWETLVSAKTVAHVSNRYLIHMR